MTARDPGFIAALRVRVRGDVRERESLSRWSTYRIGGPATVFHPASGEDVAMALRVCADHGVGWFALGLGSNLLFPDEGLSALVIRMGKGVDELSQGGNRWTIGAGLPQPLAAKRTASAGFGGIHKMVGVPGSVGGGIVMNAGCHGAEWRDTVVSVLVVDAAGNDRIVAAADARFTYRRSALGNVVVLSATVELHAADRTELEHETEELYRWRREQTPFNRPCCGSVFKNPPLPADRDPTLPRTAGQFVEAAGLKGFAIGGAQVSPMHANYIVNTEDATAADVLSVMREVRQRVADKFGLVLEPEVKVIDAHGGTGPLS
jgi:UDP-N-acetylmuramate dehydrogenase